MKLKYSTGFPTPISRMVAALLPAIAVVIAAILPTQLLSQDSFRDERIAVAARPSPDSIVLRWAPLTTEVWLSGNAWGYRIERFVVTEHGNVVMPPRKTLLQASVRPWQQSDWETLVRKNKYAAIAAQALFGDRFEVDLIQRDVFSIVNKVRENEQRYSFLLFSADMSASVATASGLRYTDTDIRHGEKYLYRIIINGSDSIRGSCFVGPDDPYDLPEPQNLRVEFTSKTAHLKWERIAATPYSAFAIERSDDGVTFNAVTDLPVVTVTPNTEKDAAFEYAIDSLSNRSAIIHYRVRGLTPFGESGPPSDIVSGKPTEQMDQVPFIVSADNINNRSILIRWSFPESNNNAISGFMVERAVRPDEPYSPLMPALLSADTRMFEDQSPAPSNYYRVHARGRDGRQYSSHVYFAQLIDSIPPSVPTGLTAKVDSAGNVVIAWAPNSESDIFGYRVYKSYHLSEEQAQVTQEPVRDTTFTDRVALNILNEYVYYRIMAIDVNQNHSELSRLLKITLPDKVNPQAPVLLPVRIDSSAVTLSWIPGGSEDVASYRVYKKSANDSLWTYISTIPSGQDSVYRFKDTSASQLTSYYTVVSVDDAGLESSPAYPVAGIIPPRNFPPPVVWKKPKLQGDENRIVLNWTYTEGGVRSFTIYRSVDELPPLLLESLPPEPQRFADTVIPGHMYRYRIIAWFADGRGSRLSEELHLKY